MAEDKRVSMLPIRQRVRVLEQRAVCVVSHVTEHVLCTVIVYICTYNPPSLNQKHAQSVQYALFTFVLGLARGSLARERHRRGAEAGNLFRTRGVSWCGDGSPNP